MSFFVRADFRDGMEATLFLKGSLVSDDHIDMLSSRVLNLEKRGARRFNIDLSGLEYLNSSGIGAFVREFKRLTVGGLTIIFVNPRPEVRQIFEKLSLLPLLEGKDPVSPDTGSSGNSDQGNPRLNPFSEEHP